MKAVYFAPVFVLKAGLLFVSLAFVVSGIMMNAASSGSKEWPSVPGMILAGQVVEEKQYAGPGGGPLICYRAEVRYSYAVDGITYHNNKISYHGSRCIGSRRGQRLAEELLSRYPSGGGARVFHDPDNPRKSCLEPGRTGDGTGMIMLGGFGVLAFLVYAGGRALDRYGGTEEFVLHGKSGETVYEETVGPPVRVYAWAIAAVTLTWLVLPIVVLLVLLPGSLGVGHVGSYLAFLLRHPPWAVLLAVTGAAAGLLLLFGNRTISYSRSGILLPVGPFKSRRLIPADAVVSCEEVDYPAWPASWFAGPVRDHQDTRTIRVPGYRGPAVLLHYHPGRKRKGDRKQTSEVGSILFPCRRPGHICSLLSQDIDL